MIKKDTIFIVFWFLVLIVTFDIQAQKARLFSTDSELSNSLINDIFQDHKGIIWVATEDGLNKYDGNKFTIYKEETGEILNNNIRLLYEDKRNNLFLGYFNGLQVYNRPSDSFTDVPLILENGSRYSAHVLSILEMINGEVWVGTSGHGIFTLHLENDSIVGRQKSSLVTSRYIIKLFQSRNGDIWVESQDMGINLLSTEGENRTVITPNIGDKNNISSICEDKNGDIYVGSLNAGLLKYNSTLGEFKPVASETQTQDFAVVSLFVTENNMILVGTDGNGLKHYDPNKDEISDLNFNVSNFNFSKTKVHDIMQDKEGNYWLGLYQKGAVLIPSRSNDFEYIGYRSVSSDIIGSNYIVSLLPGDENSVWVGTDSDGLYKILPPYKQLAHYTYENTANAPKTVMCMLKDSKGNFWIGTYIDGLISFDEKSERFKKIKRFLDRQGDPISRITDLAEDQNGVLWISTLGFGLYSVNLDTDEIINYTGSINQFHPNEATNSIHNSWLTSLMVSSDNKIYVGSVDGLNIYDPVQKTFRLLNDLGGMLWGQSVYSIFEDSSGLIWMGAAGGLFSFNPKNDEIIKYTTNNGLPNNNICAIEEDDSGHLWISTHYGISRFNMSAKTFNNYYYHDGIQGNEFSKHSSIKNLAGEIYFSGINGITYFDPQLIETRDDSIRVEIVGFYIQDKAVKKGMKSGEHDIITTSLIEADTFNLSHDDNSFSIEFSAMEFMNPQRISYLYAIGDSEWISLQHGTNNLAFNNLKPGSHVINIRAKDFNNYSSIKSIVVTVYAPWYLTNWAKFMYILISILILIGLGAYIIQWNEHKEKVRKHLYTRKINEAKLEFFTNISHEIRTPLSLILNPIKKLIVTDTDNNRQRSYNMIRRNSEKILHLVNQLMDLRQIDRGKIQLKYRETNMVDFIRDTLDIFEESVHAKHLSLRVDQEVGVPLVWIDQNYFDKVIQNLVSNAIKFTPNNGRIELRIEADEERVIVYCIDSGMGLGETDLEKIFDRFYQGSNKVDSMGNGIGLHLTRSILELHQGTIYAKNNSNGIGATFVLSIPKGKDHLDEGTLDMSVDVKVAKTLPEKPQPLEEQELTHERLKSKSKRKVLVVDDDAEIRDYICTELSGDYHMLECESGKVGLAMVLEMKPDLVISDVVMPEMDGISLCKKIKQNININHIPVVLLTAKSNESDNLEGLGIGADAYISKPFNMEILKKTVENLVKNRDLLRNNYSGKQQQDDKVKQVEMTSADEKLMNKIMDIINKNIDNTDLNVEMIAEEIGISRVHLYRKLKEITNQSVSDLIRNIRLKQGADLLSSKNLSVSEVAYATGFSNPSKFSTSFKNSYGVSPSVYAERQQNKSAG